MNKKKVLVLLDQMIEKAEEEDEQHKIRMFSSHSCQKAVGKGWMVFHLEKLKELVKND